MNIPMYVARNLCSLTTPYLSVENAPLILLARFNGTYKDVFAYKLTPMLYAALEHQFGRLDNAVFAGKLFAEQVVMTVDRVGRIQTHANHFLDQKLVSRARTALANEFDALATVLAKYEELMGGKEAVRELEETARRCPFRGGDGEDNGNGGLADGVVRVVQTPESRLAG